MNYLHLTYGVIATLLLAQCIQHLLQRLKLGGHLPRRFRSFEIFGNVDWTVATHSNAFKFLKYARKYGATYRLASIRTPIGALVTSDVENINTLFTGKDWGVWWRLDGMEPMMGVGFLTRDGDEWMKSRKMLRPSFSKGNLEDLTLLGQAIDSMIGGIQEDQAIDIQPLLQKTFMDSSLNFILGMDPFNQENDITGKPPMTVKEFLALWQKGLMGLGIRLMCQRILFLLPTKGHFDVCKRIHSFIIHYLDESKAKPTSTKSKKRSMADVVLSQTDDEKYACSQLSQGMLASQETTSVLTSNVVQLLAQNPELWKEVREEVLSQGDELLNYDALRDNTVLQHTLLETLRYRPVFPVIARKAYRDTTFPTNSHPTNPSPFPIPAGTTAIIDLMSLFRNPDIFGPDVDTYNPHRWNIIKPSAKEFCPFGNGPRACLGKEKVLVEAAFLLVKMAREFEIVEGKNDKEKMSVMISMKNMEGCRVAFKRAERN